MTTLPVTPPITSTIPKPEKAHFITHPMAKGPKRPMPAIHPQHAFLWGSPAVQGYLAAKGTNPEQPYKSVVNDLFSPDTRVNAHELGTLEFESKLTSGGVIALLGSLSSTNFALATKEILGFAGFYGSMGILPHIVHWWVKQKTGVDLEHNYLSTQGDKRNLFTDPQYLPLQLLPNQEIDAIGNKLDVPKHLSNRRRVIEDKIRSTVAQAQTWWMITAGPLVPIIGSGLVRVVEPLFLKLSNKAQQVFWQSKVYRNPDHPKYVKRFDHLLATVVGSSPNTELSRWWTTLQKDVVKELDIPKALEALPRRERQHQSWWHRVMKTHIRRLSAAHVHGRSPAIQKRLQKLKNRLDSTYLSKITEMEGKLNTWATRAPHKTLRSHHVQALNAAKNMLRQYKQLLTVLQRPDVFPTDATIHTLLQGGTTTNITRLLENGQYNTAKTVLGSQGNLIEAIGASHSRQGQRLNSLMGATIADQLTKGAKEVINSRHFNRWLVGGVGGGIALASAIFYQLVLSKTSRRRKEGSASSTEILNKYNATHAFERLQATIAAQKTLKTTLPLRNTTLEKPGYLKQLFKQSQAVIYALNLRTFGATDANHDGVIQPQANEHGTFLSAINRLDELQSMGVNTIHLLPINPVGTIKQKGTGGSVYAVADYHTLNPQLKDNTSPLNIYQQARQFIQAAHQRGIQVMVDVPSVAAYDLAITRPDLISVDGHGHTLTPADWEDVVLFKNDKNLQDYYEGFFDLMANDVGVDGFRVDVARSRPNWFWQHFIGKYPNHAWMAESYVEEDASPLQNIPRDVPETLLGLGFDSVYGQNHIFPKIKSGQAYMDYLLEIEGMFKRANLANGNPPVAQGKSVIGSFLTHDDNETLMDHGGIAFNKFCLALMAFQPYTNPYLIDGMQSGYPHRINIFDYAPAHKGSYPGTAGFIQQVFNTRAQYADVLANGQFTPHVITKDPHHQLFAYSLSHNGKTLLVVGNKDVNARSTGHIELALPSQAPLVNLIPEYGRQSSVHAQPDKLHVSMGPARLMVFEI